MTVVVRRPVRSSTSRRRSITLRRNGNIYRSRRSCKTWREAEA